MTEDECSWDEYNEFGLIVFIVIIKEEKGEYKVKTKGRIFVSVAAAAVMLGAAGCSGSSPAEDNGTIENTAQVEQFESVKNDENKGSGDVIEVSGEFDVVPEEYPWIAADEFQSAFDEFHTKASAVDANSMTYDDIEDIFGVPGAYYVDKDYNDGQYKYYKWFSDDDKDVLITFNGDGMTYFAWTSSTVSATQ